MKLPQILHKLGRVSAVVFIVAIMAGLISAIAFGSQPSRGQWVIIALVLTAAGGSLVTMVGSFIAEPLVRSAERAALRRNGLPASATVVDFYGIKGGAYHGWREIKGVRAKLKVHLPDGGSFEAIVEDTFDVGLQLRQGQTFPVKYDPRTKEVALVMPGKVAEAPRDF